METTGKITEKSISSGVKADGKTPWERVAFTVSDKKYSIFISDLNRELIDSFNPGDTVKLTYTKSGVFSNITQIEKASEVEVVKPENAFGKEIVEAIDESKEQGQSVWDKKDLRISKMNGVNNAVALLQLIGLPEKTTKEETLQIVKNLADELVNYIYG